MPKPVARAAQRPGGDAGAVAERRDGRLHAFAHAGAHAVGVADHLRHRGPGHAGLPGHVVDRDRSPACCSTWQNCRPFSVAPSRRPQSDARNFETFRSESCARRVDRSTVMPVTSEIGLHRCTADPPTPTQRSPRRSIHLEVHMRFGTSRRGSVAVAFLAAGALSLSACSGLGGSDDSSSGNEITFLTNNDPNNLVIAEAVIKAFEEANPDIDVKLDTRPGGGRGRQPGQDPAVDRRHGRRVRVQLRVPVPGDRAHDEPDSRHRRALGRRPGRHLQGGRQRRRRRLRLAVADHHRRRRSSTTSRCTRSSGSRSPRRGTSSWPTTRRSRRRASLRSSRPSATPGPRRSSCSPTTTTSRRRTRAGPRSTRTTRRSSPRRPRPRKASSTCRTSRKRDSSTRTTRRPSSPRASRRSPPARRRTTRCSRSASPPSRRGLPGQGRRRGLLRHAGRRRRLERRHHLDAVGPVHPEDRRG